MRRRLAGFEYEGGCGGDGGLDLEWHLSSCSLLCLYCFLDLLQKYTLLYCHKRIKKTGQV